MSNKFEKLISYIINEDEAKAKALFHQIVVEKSRSIYEDLQSDEMGADNLGDEIGDDEDIVDGDETGLDDDLDAGDDEDLSADDDLDGGDDIDAGADEDEGLENRVMDLEDALDELKAEFDDLLNAEENEEENYPGIHDEDGGEGNDLAAEDDENELDADADMDEDNESEQSDLDADEDLSDVEESKNRGIYGESKNRRKSASDLMREYVEKVTNVKPTEGDEVGASSTKQPINSRSTTISGKNDMGGTTKNIAQGGAASDRDSNTGPKKPSNAYTKGETTVPGAGKFQNVPGGSKKLERAPAAKTKVSESTKPTVRR